jgi:hypothetical protein
MRSGYMTGVGLWAVSVLVTLVAVGAVQAVPVTFAFSGQVTSIVDNSHVLAGDVLISDTFTGTYTYESTLSDLSSSPVVGEYRSANSVMHVLVGAFNLWSGTDNSVWVENGSPGSSSDSLDFGSSNFDSAGLQVTGMRVILYDFSAGMLLDDSLPLAPPPMSSIGLSRFQIEGYRGAADHVGFAINGTAYTLTPEPGAIGLFAIGAFFCRRSSRGASGVKS